jgi:hypothetical protein
MITQASRLSARQRGFTTVEYIVALTAMIVALFMPFGGDPSVMAQFLTAVRDMHAAGSFALSLP